MARRDYLQGMNGSAARDVGAEIDRKAEPTIVLRRGGATGTIVYAIKRRCANPTGNFAGLPVPPPDDPPPPPPPPPPRRPVINAKRAKLMAELKNVLKKKGMAA